jgi:peptide/nickel transport system substrate-binding protein
VAPGLAESWDVLDGGRTYVFHLRKGLKWSDGAPMTSDDFLFSYEDGLCNKDLSPVFPNWLVLGGEPVRVTAPDPVTVVFSFAAPYGTFLEMMTYRGNFLVAPKHYLKQFHPRYTDPAALDAQVRALGLNHWRELYGQKANPNENPELPVMHPFVLDTKPPASRMIAVRNPYYWKVDPAGNQLPYIDRVAFTDVQNNEIVTIKAMAGEVDFQNRRIDASNFSLLLQNRAKGHYRVLGDYEPASVVLYLNQYSKDPVLRPILEDRRFRIALSVAINRPELIQLLFRGLATPSRGVASPYDPYYLPEYDEKYMQYDPVLANRLLDEAGLARGKDGMRTLPGGRPFRQMINVFPSEAGTSTDLWQLVADYFREVGLDFVIKVDALQLSTLQVTTGNSDFWAYSVAGLHWALDPIWFIPWASNSYFAPAYGRYVASNGKDEQGVKPPPEFQRLVDWYLELRSVVNDDQKRLELGHKILGQWADECYTIGICRQKLPTIVSDRFKNVPDHLVHDYRVMTPGYIGIEQFYIENGKNKTP